MITKIFVKAESFGIIKFIRYRYNSNEIIDKKNKNDK